MLLQDSSRHPGLQTNRERAHPCASFVSGRHLLRRKGTFQVLVSGAEGLVLPLEARGAGASVSPHLRAEGNSASSGP